MPSSWHDTVNELFKERPELAVEILRDLMGVDLPPGIPANLGPSAFNTRPSNKLIADTIIIAGPIWEAAHGIVVEAQQKRSEAKRQRLPRYAAALWLEFDCPVDVLVICPDEATAAWYARPIPTKVPGYTFRPRVLYPSQVPSITSTRQAAMNPAMAVLSVAYHGHDRAVADAFVAGVGSLGGERGLQYYEYGYDMSPRAVCAILEELVTTTHWPVYSPFARLHYGRGMAEGLEEGRGEGLIEGERRALLEVLQARGLEVTKDQRAHIADCTDLEQLKAWVRSAITVASTGDLFQ
jgi:hypothetical protein